MFIDRGERINFGKESGPDTAILEAALKKGDVVVAHGNEEKARDGCCDLGCTEPYAQIARVVDALITSNVHDRYETLHRNILKFEKLASSNGHGGWCNDQDMLFDLLSCASALKEDPNIKTSTENSRAIGSNLLRLWRR